MSTTEKVFAPAKVVKGKYGIKIGIKVDDFVAFLNQNKKDTGWINLELKESVKGVQYIELDTWQPTQASTNDKYEPTIVANTSDDLPF